MSKDEHLATANVLVVPSAPPHSEFENFTVLAENASPKKLSAGEGGACAASDQPEKKHLRTCEVGGSISCQVWMARCHRRIESSGSDGRPWFIPRGRPWWL